MPNGLKITQWLKSFKIEVVKWRERWGDTFMLRAIFLNFKGITIEVSKCCPQWSVRSFMKKSWPQFSFRIGNLVKKHFSLRQLGLGNKPKLHSKYILITIFCFNWIIHPCIWEKNGCWEKKFELEILDWIWIDF